MIIQASGQLRHHFWGTYAASIGIKFHNADLAGRALPQFPGWKQSTVDPRCLTFHGQDPALADTLQLLGKLGADLRKVSSLARSIDFGEPFTVAVDLTQPDTTVQIGLFQ